MVNWCGRYIFGRPEGIRTPIHFVRSEALCPVKLLIYYSFNGWELTLQRYPCQHLFGGPTPIRTENNRVWSAVGCQLRSPTLEFFGRYFLSSTANGGNEFPIVLVVVS